MHTAQRIGLGRTGGGGGVGLGGGGQGEGLGGGNGVSAGYGGGGEGAGGEGTGGGAGGEGGGFLQIPHAVTPSVWRLQHSAPQQGSEPPLALQPLPITRQGCQGRERGEEQRWAASSTSTSRKRLSVPKGPAQ